MRNAIPKTFLRDVILADNRPATYRITYSAPVPSLYVGVKDGALKHPMIHGIFDTGAQGVCLRTGLPKKWGFEKIGETKVSGAVSSTAVGIYTGSLSLCLGSDKTLRFDSVVAWESPLPGDVEALIGQPIIKLFNFEVVKGFTCVVLKV